MPVYLAHVRNWFAMRLVMVLLVVLCQKVQGTMQALMTAPQSLGRILDSFHGLGSPRKLQSE